MATCSQTKNYCAICAQLAYIPCNNCHNISYCSERHREIDYNLIHHRICDSLKEVHGPMQVLLSETERKQQGRRRKEIKLHIIKVCRDHAKDLIWRHNYESAVPAAMQELRWVTDLFGAISIEAIPTYCNLAEAALGQHFLDKAEEYVSQAMWCFQKGTPSNRYKFWVFRALGTLYEEKKQLAEARDALAEHVYYGGQEWGPTSIQTLWGYLHLGLTFLDKPLTAYSFFSQEAITSLDDAQVVDIAHSYLMPFVKVYFDRKNKEDEIELQSKGEGVFSHEDLLFMLTLVKGHMSKLCKSHISAVDVTTLFFLLGTLHHFCATNKAAVYLQHALLIGDQHLSCKHMMIPSKRMYQLEQQRLRAKLHDKMGTAMNWEGMPGTWHNIDVASNEASHTSLINYYGMLDSKERPDKEADSLVSEIMRLPKTDEHVEQEIKKLEEEAEKLSAAITELEPLEVYSGTTGLSEMTVSGITLGSSMTTDVDDTKLLSESSLSHG